MLIGFIGAGNMAFALAAAMCGTACGTAGGRRAIASDVDPERLSRFVSGIPGSAAASDNREVIDRSDVTFLSVKPQVIDAVCAGLARTGSGPAAPGVADRLVVSIAAGVRLARLESALPGARVVRVMPNTPALVGRMAAAWAAGSRVTEADRELVGSLLASAGFAVELDEPLLDAVTALSGSGPAFVARLIGAFVDGGEAVGLPAQVARELALATFSGTAALMGERSIGEEELVRMVSSPGGTTVAGREVLERSDYREVILRTIAAAAERSRELGE